MDARPSVETAPGQLAMSRMPEATNANDGAAPVASASVARAYPCVSAQSVVNWMLLNVYVQLLRDIVN